MIKLHIIILTLFLSISLPSCNKKYDYGNIEATNIRRIFVTENEGLPMINNENYRGLFDLDNQIVLLSDNVYFMAVEMTFISNIETKQDFSPRFDVIIEVENFNVLSSKTYEISSGKNIDIPVTLDDGSRSVVSTSTFSTSSGENLEVTYYAIMKLSPKLDNDLDEVDSRIIISFEPKDDFYITGMFQDGKTYTITIKGETD
jgi:hypothetical protein